MEKRMEEVYFMVLEAADKMLRNVNEHSDSEEKLEDLKLDFEELIGEDAVEKFDEYMDSSYEHEADKDFLRVQLAYLIGIMDAQRCMAKEHKDKTGKEAVEKMRKEMEDKLRKEYDDKQ